MRSNETAALQNAQIMLDLAVDEYFVGDARGLRRCFSRLRDGEKRE